MAEEKKFKMLTWEEGEALMKEALTPGLDWDHMPRLKAAGYDRVFFDGWLDRLSPHLAAIWNTEEDRQARSVCYNLHKRDRLFFKLWQHESFGNWLGCLRFKMHSLFKDGVILSTKADSGDAAPSRTLEDWQTRRLVRRADLDRLCLNTVLLPDESFIDVWCCFKALFGVILSGPDWIDDQWHNKIDWHESQLIRVLWGPTDHLVHGEANKLTSAWLPSPTKYHNPAWIHVAIAKAAGRAIVRHPLLDSIDALHAQILDMASMNDFVGFKYEWWRKVNYNEDRGYSQEQGDAVRSQLRGWVSRLRQTRFVESLMPKHGTKRKAEE